MSKLCGQAGLLYPRSLLFTQSGLWVWGRTRLRKEGPDLEGCFRFRGPPKLGQCQEGYVGSEPRAPSKLASSHLGAPNRCPVGFWRRQQRCAK